MTVRRPGCRPSRARRSTYALLVAALTATGLVGCGKPDWQEKCSTSADKVIECAAGDRPAAPKVVGELLDGGRYDLSQDRGQVVVVNFWGSWCAPCRAEADDLEASYQATKGSGVRFLGINIQDGRDKAIAFEQGQVSYPSIFDPASRLALDFEVPPNSIPATIVLDREGRIAVVIRRPIREETLTPIVTRIAGEAAGSAGAG